MSITPSFDLTATLQELDSAAQNQLLLPASAANIRQWLVEPRYREYAAQVAAMVAKKQWKDLDDNFFTVIPFGTGGRRGRMNPVGCNAINDRTIGESAQGLATYLRETLSPDELSCALAYDPRHRSRHFAELCAGIMVANGFKVYFLDGYRSTPELSFLVRYKKCACGIMVTASHNPPSDNAVKVYGSTGGQVLPPHDKAIIERVMSVSDIARVDFAEAVKSGQVVMCEREVDEAFARAVVSQRLPGPRNLKIIYSPLHGVGESAVAPALAGDGFTEVEIFAPHREPHPDFPNVPGHVSNPELPLVFDAMIERAQATGADLCLATDPDCDRLGAAAPLTRDSRGPWATFTGNQIGALLTDYILEARRKAGSLTAENYVVKTLVTTEMIRRIADAYGVKTYGNLHVGFKWIGEQIDAAGPAKFVFGAEESHGYLVGEYARDKDGAVAAMLLAELAAKTKQEGKSLHEKLDSLMWQYGCHVERLLNLTMKGAQGMQRMKDLMAVLRANPPRHLGAYQVASIRDYAALTRTPTGGTSVPLDARKADMVILDFAAEGNYVAVRPSGTEPKVKFYMFGYVPAEQLHDLAAVRGELNERFDAIERDLNALAEKV